MEITNILGATMPVVHTWADGSFQCPFCGAPVFTPNERCDNPACAASKWATPANREHFQAAQDRYTKQQQQEAERKRNHEVAMRRIQEDNVARQDAAQAFYAKVKEVGGCWRCSDKYHGKVRRHRGGCPKAH